MNVLTVLRQARTSAQALAHLNSVTKDVFLAEFAKSIDEHRDWILKQNQKDLRLAGLKPDSSLHQRLKLDAAKLDAIIAGIRDIARLPDPCGQIQFKIKLDEGLILERQTVPIGVLAIVFEARPDVIPQILSLALKSGNTVLLKGGSEARHSNDALFSLAMKVTSNHPELPPRWAQMLHTRLEFGELLKYHQYIDLVIPRGSNKLVRTVMASTKIPVLGHADGVCHLYVHESAYLDRALALAIDAKTQYPAACNAIETLLVDEAIAQEFLSRFAELCEKKGIKLIGCPRTKKILPRIARATKADWSTEYGDLRLSVKVVRGFAEAVMHINQYGSHHTDAIVASDAVAQGRFLDEVDSASVFANASTRFADGYRFGLGAEVGISTARVHARGPVGLDGLVIHKYRLIGGGHCVADYMGPDAKPFIHQILKGN